MKNSKILSVNKTCTANPLHVWNCILYRCRNKCLCSMRLMHSQDASVEHTVAPQHGYRSIHFINFLKASVSCNWSIFSTECLNTLRGEEMGIIPVCRSQAESVFGDTATLRTGNVQLWISLKLGSQTPPSFKSFQPCPKWNTKVLSQMAYFMFTCRLVDLQRVHVSIKSKRVSHMSF